MKHGNRVPTIEFGTWTCCPRCPAAVKALVNSPTEHRVNVDVASCKLFFKETNFFEHFCNNLWIKLQLMIFHDIQDSRKCFFRPSLVCETNFLSSELTLPRLIKKANQMRWLKQLTRCRRTLTTLHNFDDQWNVTHFALFFSYSKFIHHRLSSRPSSSIAEWQAIFLICAHKWIIKSQNLHKVNFYCGKISHDFLPSSSCCWLWLVVDGSDRRRARYSFA